MCYNSENANLSAIVFDRTDAYNGKRRNHAVGYRNCGKRAAQRHTRSGGSAVFDGRRAGTLRKIQGETLASQGTAQKGETYLSDRHQSHRLGRGENHRFHRSCRRHEKARKESVPRAAGAVARPRFRHQGRRRGRRVCAGGAHGGHQPAFYGRSSRHHRGEQFALRFDG